MIKKYFQGPRMLTSYGIAYTLSGAIQKGVGFLVFMLFAGIFTVSEYAQFGMSYSVFTAISALASAGIVEAVVSLILENKDEDSKKGLFKAANAVFIILALVASIAGAILILVFYQEYFDHKAELAFVVFGAVLSSFFIFQSILVRLNEKHQSSLVLSFVPALLGYVCGYLGPLKVFLNHLSIDECISIYSLLLLVNSITIIPKSVECLRIYWISPFSLKLHHKTLAATRSQDGLYEDFPR